jgi:hypothetical protein
MQMRPFHLMVAFWGVRYRDYFVKLCLPSLLAPRNLPLLVADDGNRFYMATTDEDWHEIEKSPIVKRLSRHVQPVHVRIGSPQSRDYNATIQHEQICFRMLLDSAYSKQAYGCLLSPDVMVPDGTIETLVCNVRDGYRLVLCPSLRLDAEAVLGELAELGLVPRDAQLHEAPESIVIPKRVAARLSVRHLHPDLFIFEEGAKDQPERSPFRFWRSGQGLILHSFFGTPVLMDFSCVPEDHTSCLDDDHPFESTYVSRNFSTCSKIHVVRDSDEFVLLSLTPSVPVAETLTAPRRYRSLCSIRRSYKHYTNDGRDLVRAALSRSVSRWHEHDRDDCWSRWEGEIMELIDQSIGDYWRGGKSIGRRVLYEFIPTIISPVSSWSLTYAGWHLCRAIGGHKDSLRWVNWATRKYLAAIAGHPFQEPRPPV